MGHTGQTALGESLRGVEAEIAARQPERALMLSQEVQARYPRALAVQRVTGEVYLALRKTREAIGALDRALAGDPEDARACCARAIVQQIQGDSMGALAWYRRACDMRPGDKVLLSAYRELARSLNQPAYEPSRVGLARLYLRGNLFAHAIREWESILGERPDALEAQVGLVETLWCAHDTQAAERCRRLLLNAPSCVKALLILAAIEHDAGHDDEARTHLRRAAELDPDMRIARELFADRLAANDRSLSLLVFGEEPAISRVPSVPLAQTAVAPAAGAQRLMTGPLTGANGIPAARVGTGTLTPQVPHVPQVLHVPQQPPTTGTLPAPSTTGTLPPAAYGTSAPVSRPNGLPPDFHRIFSETSGMLWHDDMEGQETQGRIPNMPAFDRSRTDLFARSQQGGMPPALMGASGSLEDTETRLSINFLNWLQAQGAVAQNLAMPGMSGMQGNTGPVPVPLPPRQRPTSQPLDDAAYSSGSNDGTGPLQTGPLPPPTSEALKAMFAELGTETAARRIVDADVVSVRDESDWNVRRDDVIEAMPAEPGSVDAATSLGDDLEDGRGAAPWSDTDAEAAGWIVGAFAQNTPERPDEMAGPPASADATSRVEDIATGELPAYPIPSVLASGPLMPAAEEGNASWWMDAGGAGGDDGASGTLERANLSSSPGPFGWAAFADPAESATDGPPLGAAFSGFAPSGDEIPAESATATAPSSLDLAVGAQPVGAGMTLEALEQGFAQSGFESYELRPGELAGMAGMPATASDEPPLGLALGAAAYMPAPDVDREDRATTATPSQEPEPVRASAASVPMPASDDYAGRLSLARERRAAGNLDGALGEYRIILKNAPDLLGDVMDELHESLAAAPDHPEVHRLLGDAHIRQGDYLSALESYNRAVALTQAQGG